MGDETGPGIPQLPWMQKVAPGCVGSGKRSGVFDQSSEERTDSNDDVHKNHLNPSILSSIHILLVCYERVNHFYLRQADYICCAAIKKFIENAGEILYNAQLVRVPFM